MVEYGRSAYNTPDFDASDPLVCHSILLRPSLWEVVYNELQKLSKAYSWEQRDPTHATVDEVIAEIEKATDNSIFAGCMMIGDIKLIARDAAAWELECDGTVYLNSDYPLLAAVIDAAYVVDGTHFRVPDMIDRFPLGSTIVAQQGGESAHVLTIAEMPAHTHSEQDPGSVVVQAGTPSVALSDPGLPSQTGSTGGGDAHNNMPPYETARFVIVARYPSA